MLGDHKSICCYYWVLVIGSGVAYVDGMIRRRKHTHRYLDLL